MNSEFQNAPPTLRRILNRFAMLIFSTEATKFEGVSCEAISALLADCTSVAKTDIQIANALFSRIANQLEDLESRLVYKYGTEILKPTEPWRRAKSRELKYAPEFSTLLASADDDLKNAIKFQLQKWFTVSQETIARKIITKDLLTLPELLAARNEEKRQVRNALKSDRMFFVVAPDNEKYYPSFFANDNPYFQRCVARVCKQLATVSGEVKYGFLTTAFPSLGAITPIEALHTGKLEEVIDIVHELV